MNDLNAHLEEIMEESSKTIKAGVDWSLNRIAKLKRGDALWSFFCELAVLKIDESGIANFHSSVALSCEAHKVFPLIESEPYFENFLYLVGIGFGSMMYLNRERFETHFANRILRNQRIKPVVV